MALGTQISATISDSKAYFIAFSSLLSHMRNIADPDSLFGKLQIRNTVKEIRHAFGEGNGRVNDLFLSQEHIVKLEEVVRKLLVVCIFAFE